MTPVFAILLVLLLVAQIVLPRKYAFLPLVVGACHMGNVEVFAELTTVRLIILLGLLRAIFTGGLKVSTSVFLDKMMIIFGVFAVLSAVGHSHRDFNPWIARCGLVLNVLGTYFYGRSFLPTLQELRLFAKAMPLVLLPLAVSLVAEKVIERNYYSYLGSGSLQPQVRDDKIRAQGPFRHAILAGCCGATAIPFAIYLWSSRRRLASVVGVLVSISIVLSCASSGPLAAVAVSLGAVVAWRWREKIYWFFGLGVGMAVFYWIVAGRGPWYIMASIDLVGGSTGWHRAKLFDQGFAYLDEWWLWGTDYTRHWMATGVSWSVDHVDLTNYYLHLGVTGGLALPLIIVVSISWSLLKLVESMRYVRGIDGDTEFLLWCLGAAICTHAVSFVSISYFDQMYVFFYLSLAAVPGAVLSGPVSYRSDSSDESESRPLAGGSVHTVG